VRVLRKPTALGALTLLLLALAAAGCGGGSEAAAPATEQPATEQPATEQPATEQPATEQPATEEPVPAEIAPAPTPEEGAAPWPAPPNPMELTREAGFEPQRREFLQFHLHAHLDVFVNGEPVLVPAGIGIAIDDPGVQRGEVGGAPAYGSIRLCEEPCISPVHTHTISGVIHTESLLQRINRLGEFFVEWDVALDESCVGGYCEPEATIQVFVDGLPYEGNPADIELTDLREIAIVIGTPPAEIPAAFDFTGAV
jgi:hypothetical protein